MNRFTKREIDKDEEASGNNTDDRGRLGIDTPLVYILHSKIERRGTPGSYGNFRMAPRRYVMCDPALARR